MSLLVLQVYHIESSQVYRNDHCCDQGTEGELWEPSWLSVLHELCMCLNDVGCAKLCQKNLTFYWCIIESNFSLADSCDVDRFSMLLAADVFFLANYLAWSAWHSFRIRPNSGYHASSTELYTWIFFHYCRTSFVLSPPSCRSVAVPLALHCSSTSLPTTRSETIRTRLTPVSRWAEVHVIVMNTAAVTVCHFLNRVHV